ncbi:MAG: hypothetical protein NVS4B11_23760 [Ktedonobacteraceae bacterium]
MRGKLRDKHATKRDVLKREVIERKRPAKHDARLAPWLKQELDEQDDALLEEEGEEETVITVLPQPQPQKK